MKPLAPLGTRARVTIRRVVRVQYRLEWEYDGWEWSGDYSFETDLDDSELVLARRLKSRYVCSAAVAYRMAAMRLIFAKRDRLATGKNDKGYPSGCTACDATPSHPEDPGRCRYHGGDGFEELRKRLARWLRWRDSISTSEESK